METEKKREERKQKLFQTESFGSGSAREVVALMPPSNTGVGQGFYSETRHTAYFSAPPVHRFCSKKKKKIRKKENEPKTSRPTLTDRGKKSPQKAGTKTRYSNRNNPPQPPTPQKKEEEEKGGGIDYSLPIMKVNVWLSSILLYCCWFVFL